MPVPHEIEDVYESLKVETTWLHGRWICYRQLFAESPRRIELLNESASTFFFIIQDVMLDEVQVMLSKLTDPAKTGKLQNLSLEQLQLRLEHWGEPTLAASNRTVLDRLHDECSIFRKWRNKQLAHLDLAHSMHASLNPLPGITRQMIENGLISVREYLNNVERQYNDTEYGYEHFSMNSDGSALVNLLKFGLRYHQLVAEQRIPYDDWLENEWHDA